MGGGNRMGCEGCTFRSEKIGAPKIKVTFRENTRITAKGERYEGDGNSESNSKADRLKGKSVPTQAK